MNKHFLQLSFLLCLLIPCFSYKASATHLNGAEISYKCTANADTYEVTVIVYRRCNESGYLAADLCASFACTTPISVRGADPSCNGTVFLNTNLALVSVRDADINTALCPTSKNTCTNLGTVAPGTHTPSVERYEFKGLINLGTTSGIPTACCNVDLVWTICCRSSNINSGAADQGFYVSATINRCVAAQTPCNSSPVFKNDPFSIICGNDNFVFNNGAVDPDGDSLTYSFAPALQAAASSVTYMPPLAFDRPMPWTGTFNGPFPNGISCDPANGDIMFTPPNNGGSNYLGVVCVEIKQWRTLSGVPTVIGKTRRDIQMTIRGDCMPNNPPTLTTTPPADPGTNPNIPKTSWETCAGSQICFNIKARDVDFNPPTTSDTTFLSWDNSLTQYGATFSPVYNSPTRNINGPREDVYQFCWTPTNNMSRSQPYYFTVTAKDKRCPNPGRMTRAFSIKVNTGNTDFILQKQKINCNSYRYFHTKTIPTATTSNPSYQIANIPNDFSFGQGSVIYNGDTTPVFIRTVPGKYLIKFTATSGTCTTIRIDTLLVDTTTIINLNDTAMCSPGTIQLNATASFGAVPYTYKWFNSITDVATTPLNAVPYANGAISVNVSNTRYYTLQVEDNNGCLSYDSVKVTVGPPVGNIISQHITCNSSNTGKITVQMLTDTSLYTYKLNTGSFQSSPVFNQLLAGNFTVHIKDSNNCVTTVSNIILTQPKPLTDTLTSVTPETCRGNNNAIFKTTAMGGTSPYKYSKDSLVFNNSSGVFTSLSPKIYTIHILDAQNCYYAVTRTVFAKDSFQFTKTITNATCSTPANGQVKISATGGTKPYQYKMNSGAYRSDSIFNTLTSGKFLFTVVDSNFCTIKDSISVTAPPLLLATALASKVNCFGDSTGSIKITASGGIPPLMYKAGPQSYQSDSLIRSLKAGTYSVYVTDSLNCSKILSVAISQNTLFKINTATTVNEKCKGQNNGSITISATGGTSPYRYSIDSNIFAKLTVFANLAPNSYTVHLLDTNNCYAKYTTAVIAADSLYFKRTVKMPACSTSTNGEVKISGMGGKKPYSFKINNGSFVSDSTFKNLSAGSYLFTLRDANLCLFSDSITITNPSPLQHSLVVQNVNCFGGNNATIQVSVTGGTSPYQYKIGSGNFVSQNIFSNLTQGTYSIIIRDTSGCLKNLSQPITQPATKVSLTASGISPKCFNSNDGKINIVASGGAKPYSFKLNNGLFDTISVFKNLAGGNYTVTLKDSLSCIDTTKVTLSTPTQIVAGNITGSTQTLLNSTHIYSVDSQPSLKYRWAASKGTIMQGSTNPTAIVRWDSIGTGQIGVAVYSDTTCGDTVSAIVNIGVNGLNELTKQWGLKVFPNPTKNILNINLETLPANASEKNIQLFDVQGKLLMKQELKYSQQLNIEMLAPGMYILKIGEWSGQVVKE
jgi:hypothetical protein